MWYAPWKVREETIDKNGEVVTTKRDVPREWLETDMTRGLSESDISTRRSEFGYNELESAHENMCVAMRARCLTSAGSSSSCPVRADDNFRRADLADFTGPVLYAMELAVVLAAGLQDWSVHAAPESS